MNPEIFIISFHELVHHMTADCGFAFVVLLTVVGTAAWALIAAAPYFGLAHRHKKLVKQGQLQYNSYAMLTERLAKRLLAKHLAKLPTLFLYSILAATILDYLVLVLMNSMGW